MQRIPKPESPKKQGDKQKGAPHEKDEQTRIPHPYRRSRCGALAGRPAAPSTTDEAKVLTALNLYRAKAGVSSPLTLDSGLNKAAEEVAKIILSNKPLGESKDAFAEAHKAILGYKNAELYQPIGLSMNEVSEGTYKAAPRYVCQDDAKLMGEQLMAQTGDPALEQLKSPLVTLVGIHVFEYGSATYWVAVVAEGGKTA